MYVNAHLKLEEQAFNFITMMINDIAKVQLLPMVLLQALYDEDDPENPFRKVRVTISKRRRMPKTISAKGVLIQSYIHCIYPAFLLYIYKFI